MECRRLVSTGEQPRWIWTSSGHCLWGPAAPGLSPGLPVPSCLPPRAEALGPVPASLSSTTGGAIWGGCVRGISRHTQGVLGRRLPGTRTPTLSAQLSFASSAATPRTAAFPPQAGNLSSPRGCVSLGPGCDPQLDGRGSLLGCETPRRRHWRGGGGLGRVVIYSAG